MKAACISDIHGDMKALKGLVGLIEDKGIGTVFLLGDYSSGFDNKKENIDDINAVFDILSSFDIWALPGNCDQRESVNTFAKRGANLHMNVIKFGSATVMGLGGSNPTPFNTPFEQSEKEIEDALKALEQRCDCSEKKILMSHVPPYATECDRIGQNLHVGSHALKEHIEKNRPDMVICGHIHEAGGSSELVGKTMIHNIGRVSQDNAFILDTKKISCHMDI